MLVKSVNHLIILLCCTQGTKKKKAYILDTYRGKDQIAFGCKMSAKTVKKLEGAPGVANVILCNSERPSDRANHSESPDDSGFGNKQQIPYWMITMDLPHNGELSEPQRIGNSMAKLVPILNSLLNKYSLDILSYESDIAFGCEIHEETATKLKGIPGVHVIQSSRAYSEANDFDLAIDSGCDEEEADYTPLPQFPCSFSDIMDNHHQERHEWVIIRKTPCDKVFTTEREFSEFILLMLAPVLSDRREEGTLNFIFKPSDELDSFSITLEMEDEKAKKLKGVPGLLVSRTDDDERLQVIEASCLQFGFPAKVKIYLKSEESEGVFTLVRYLRLIIGKQGEPFYE
ncbi:unnamed protein product [Linum trigynum]|uniref:MORF/ORRM1/DAG-like MORF domain-containing protein n=1 Tax=Linum trigynum TaxID=586398 RepID=A0AAV2FF53_9ROSI